MDSLSLWIQGIYIRYDLCIAKCMTLIGLLTVTTKQVEGYCPSNNVTVQQEKIECTQWPIDNILLLAGMSYQSICLSHCPLVLASGKKSSCNMSLAMNGLVLLHYRTWYCTAHLVSYVSLLSVMHVWQCGWPLHACTVPVFEPTEPFSINTSLQWSWIHVLHLEVRSSFVWFCKYILYNMTCI